MLFWYGDVFSETCLSHLLTSFWNPHCTGEWMSCAWSLATRGLSNGRLTRVCNQHRCRVLVLQQPIRGRQCGLSHIFRLQNQWVFYITTGRSGWGHTEVSTCILHSREQEGRKVKKKKKKATRPFRGKGIDPLARTKCLHLTSQQATYWNRAISEKEGGAPAATRNERFPTFLETWEARPEWDPCSFLREPLTQDFSDF